MRKRVWLVGFILVLTICAGCVAAPVDAAAAAA